MAIQIRRREFIVTLGGAAAMWPLAARAQQPKLILLGYLEPQRPTEPVAAIFRVTGDWQKFKGEAAPPPMKVAAPKPDRKALYEEAVRGNGEEPAAGATTPKKKAAPKADADTADEPEQDEDLEVGGQAGAQCAEQEQHRGDLHHRHAAQLVGQPAGHQGAGGRAEQRGGDGEAQFQGARVELGGDRLVGAVDHRAVVTEQEAPDAHDGPQPVGPDPAQAGAARCGCWAAGASCRC